MRGGGSVTVACCACGKFLPRNDAIPFGGGLAHVACVFRAQLTRSPRGRVLVFVRRKGPAFERRA